MLKVINNFILLFLLLTLNNYMMSEYNQKPVWNMLKVNNKTPEWRQVFIVNFEHNLDLFLVFLLLTLSK